MAEGADPVLTPDSPAQFLGNHWIELPDGRYRSRFPPGYPALLAVAHAVGGPAAALLVTPLLAALTPALVFIIAGQLVSGWAAVGAAGVVTALPLLSRLALHADSHVAATAVLLLALWSCLAWRASGRARLAFLAGLFAGLVPAVRYAESVALLGPLLFAAFFAPSGPARRKGWQAALAGFAIPTLALLLYHWYAYGAPYRTGYALTNEQTAFSLNQVTSSLTFYARHMSWQTWTVTGLGLFGVGALLSERSTRGAAVLFFGALIPSVLLYSMYYWGDRESAELALRFFLPSLTILGTLAVVGITRSKMPRSVNLALSLLLAVATVTSLPESARGASEESQAAQNGWAVTSVALEQVPAGAALIAPRHILEVLEHRGQWKLVPEWLLYGSPGREGLLLPWTVGDRLAAEHQTTAALTQIAKGRELRRRYASIDTRDDNAVLFDDVFDWTGGGPVYWIAHPASVPATLPEHLEGQVSQMGEIQLPSLSAGDNVPYWAPQGPLALFCLSGSSASSSIPCPG
ncbi:MAG: ArnT family glycosyltransferase [Longimicrobiales bacterium]